ncbi:F-box/kelch-repeat protein [Citrus sinensis]|uniref:F-box/kelch-repeat protein n=1 Tax=Citrus sinensis TaxID=2711 RepID=A0ACB8MAN4_CITSI|nr:F-box/kelch-repeat protein [Citrus sinensis]
MEGLPQDIIVDIFSKLPPNSLCRFKCLSKGFMALITNPWFVKLHQTQNQQRQTVVVDKCIVRDSLICFDIDRGIKTVDRLDFPIQKCPINSAWINGSCNGMVWLSTYDGTARSPVDFIYNCSTREFKRIPYYQPFDERYSLLDALGYAQSIDDFKVFGVSFHPFYEVEDFREDPNGSIHFGFCKLDFDDPVMIAAFDLVEDKLKFLALPDDIMYSYSYSIRSIGGCLCLFPEEEKEYWIMKEYGLKESWTRISSANAIPLLQPLCPFKEGSDFFLSLLGHKFALFNPKDGSYKDFIIDGFQEDLEDCNLVAYAEAVSRTNFPSEETTDQECHPYASLQDIWSKLLNTCAHPASAIP